MQGTEYERHEDFLEKTRAIFAEREKEFQLRQQAFEEKEKGLKALLKHITSERKELEGQREELTAKQKALEEDREALNSRSLELEEQEQGLKARQEHFEKWEKDQLMKYNLELEQVRNEEMKLKRLTDDYNYRISLLEPGVAEALQNPVPAVDLENYISIDEHNHRIRLGEEKVQNLMKEQDELKATAREMQKDREELKATAREAQKEREELKATIQEMQVERGKLLDKIVELRSSQTAEACGPGSKSRGETKETQPAGIVPETEEELTAHVLQSYLKRNRTDLEQLEIRHSEDGELLYAKGRGLTYHFLFVEPATFDISAERKNSPRLRRQLETCNEKFPGVQFCYDEAEKKVCATGYFTNQMKAYELMKRVQEIADCFRQE